MVDVDRPTDQHGIPPKLLFCEFEAVGYKLVEFIEKPDIAGYFARFEAVGARPAARSDKGLQPALTLSARARTNHFQGAILGQRDYIRCMTVGANVCSRV